MTMKKQPQKHSLNTIIFTDNIDYGLTNAVNFIFSSEVTNPANVFNEALKNMTDNLGLNDIIHTSHFGRITITEEGLFNSLEVNHLFCFVLGKLSSTLIRKRYQSAGKGATYTIKNGDARIFKTADLINPIEPISERNFQPSLFSLAFRAAKCEVDEIPNHYFTQISNLEIQH